MPSVAEKVLLTPQGDETEGLSFNTGVIDVKSAEEASVVQW